MIVTVPSFTRSRLGSTQVSSGSSPGADDLRPALCAAIAPGTKYTNKPATNSRLMPRNVTGGDLSNSVNSGLGLHFSQIEQCSGARRARHDVFNPRHFVEGDRASPGGALPQRGSLRMSCTPANQPSTGTFFKGQGGALHDEQE